MLDCLGLFGKSKLRLGLGYLVFFCDYLLIECGDIILHYDQFGIKLRNISI